MSAVDVDRILDDRVLSEVDARLAEADALLTSRWPGLIPGVQPVHTVYVPIDAYRRGLAVDWGRAALASARQANPAAGQEVDEAAVVAVAAAVGLPDDAGLARAVVAKLRSAPIEDLRLDAEDGYGDHPERESADVVEAATILAGEVADGTAPSRVGIRFKCLEAPTRRRGLESLELFLSTLLRQAGRLPQGLRLTCPKVTSVEQVAVMASVLEHLEVGLGLAAGTLTFEVQAETPQVVLCADGTITAARMLDAGQGRISGVHYGTYDYSAALGVDGAYQASDHPVADQAKDLLQLALAGTAVELSDGSTNLVPDGPGAVHAWREHARLVTRHLRRGIRQGWDLHPAQLVTRYLATYAYYRDGYEATASRLSAYLGGVGGDVMDEPATARALAAFLMRGVACGALSAAELAMAAPELDLAAVTALAR
jgi:hypothetical protein